MHAMDSATYVAMAVSYESKNVYEIDHKLA
jgi:hypothetical protein